jgi:hypothetical protein
MGSISIELTMHELVKMFAFDAANFFCVKVEMHLSTGHKLEPEMGRLDPQHNIRASLIVK